MNELFEHIVSKRNALTEAKIALRKAADWRAFLESSMLVQCNYQALGKNETLRKAAFAVHLSESKQWNDAKLEADDLRNDVDRLTAQLEGLTDERRHLEQTTYARAVEVLTMRERRVSLPQVVIRTAVDDWTYDDLQGAEEVGAYFDMLECDEHGPS